MSLLEAAELDEDADPPHAEAPSASAPAAMTATADRTIFVADTDSIPILLID
jgi:hypothetical protein